MGTAANRLSRRRPPDADERPVVVGRQIDDRHVGQRVAVAFELFLLRLGPQLELNTCALGPGAAVLDVVGEGLLPAVEIDGVLITDPAFAGSDTLATAKALGSCTNS